ncbi:MAG: ABC transporter ATP-binding protein [Tepidisphaeraceae bacterium]
MSSPIHESSVAHQSTLGGTEYPIDLVGVTRRFGRQAAVDDVTLKVPAGSFMGLIGLNGAGKSTLLRMAVGLLTPHAGSIRLAGCDVRHQPVEMKRRVGYVPDRPNIYGWMRVEEALEFTRSFHTTWNAPRCLDLLKRFRLPMDKRIRHLSKGQAAKLQLLLAVCHDPQVLILDEPTSGFDPIVREEFFEGILDFANDQGQTILFSSHALADVQRLADRVALMHEGKILLAGSLDDLLQRTKRVRIVTESEAPFAPLTNVIRHQRIGRESLLTLQDPTPHTLAQLRQAAVNEHIEIMDINLDDLFKDSIRSQTEATL